VESGLPAHTLGRPGGPTSIVVWGADRTEVNRVALAVARGLAPEYYWVDIQGPGPRRAELEPRPGGAEAAATPVAPEALAPNHTLGNARHWTLVVEPTGSPEAEELATHARLPDLLRRLIEQRGPGAPPATLLLSNVDLGADRFYPSEPGTFRRGLGALHRADVSVVATLGRAPRPNMEDFAHEFRVDPGTGSRGPTVTCLRTRDGQRAPFEAGGTWPLETFESSFSAASARSTERAT
jgi:hypothetical protein